MLTVVAKGERKFSLTNVVAVLPNGSRQEEVRVDATFRALSTEDNAKLSGLNVRDYCDKVVVSIDKLSGLKFADDAGEALPLVGDGLLDATLSVFEIAVALRLAHVEAITKGAARKN